MTIELSMPVVVVNGIATEHEMHTLNDLLAFLDGWPPARRGTIYFTTQRACRAAIDGQIPADQARQCFVQFARLTNILLPSVEPLVLARQGGIKHGHSPRSG